MDLSKTKVNDISILRGMSLKKLDLSQTHVTDISVLKGMPLKSLKIPDTATNIEFLRVMKSLKSINDRWADEFWEKYDKTGQVPTFIVGENEDF